MRREGRIRSKRVQVLWKVVLGLGDGRGELVEAIKERSDNLLVLVLSKIIEREQLIEVINIILSRTSTLVAVLQFVE